MKDFEIMFIQTEAMPDPTRMKFYPGETVLPSGTAEFPDEESAERSPLAHRLFEIDGVEAVMLYDTFLTVTREDGYDWQVLKPMILGAIMDHYTSGAPILRDFGSADETFEDVPLVYPYEDDAKDANIIEQIHEVMESRIRPAAQQMGGDVIYKGFREGIYYAQFVGPTTALLGGMGNLFAHFVPEVTGVRDWRDAISKPGLETEEGRAVLHILEERINPAVAGHGGRIQLIDVRDHTAYLRLEGGCQGCGSADVTLKQGVETQIMSEVPSIVRVLDVTDHAAGMNPYYAG